MTEFAPSRRRRLLTSTLLAGVAAIGAPAAVTVATSLLPTVALAQDYTSGALAGTVEDTSGAPVADATVTVRSLDTGLERTLTTDSNGRFRVGGIPQGGYSVAINKAGYQTATDGNVRVRVGGESGYSFLLAAEGEVSELVVEGQAANPQLDFSQTTTGLAIDIEELQKQVPIARNITAVTLLAPSTVQGGSAADASFRDQPAIGGSSIAENAYYVNGINITNFDNYIGGSTVPFDFYKSVEVKTGGYPAEYGRATGGIVNTVTKAGSNDFTFGVHVNWTPDFLESSQKDIFTTPTLASGAAGTPALGAVGSRRQTNNKELILEAGGPIIRDHLFFYGLTALRDFKSESATASGGRYFVDRSKAPFYGAKVDAYLNSRQHLEFTYFDTDRETERASFFYTGATDTIGARTFGSRAEAGGVTYVGKYTGSFTDWLTISGAYGVTKDKNNSIPDLSSQSVSQDVRTGVTIFRSQNTTANNEFPVNTKREFYRGDIDLYFNLLGEHHIRAGYDREDLTLNKFTSRAGGVVYITRRAGAPNASNLITNIPGVDTGLDYIELNYFQTGGTFEGRNQAFYVQDSWDVLSNLTLNLGVRVDKFRQNIGDGSVGYEFTGEVGPRLGVVWDPGNDGRNKIFANFGRYYLPVAANTAFRQGAPETFFREYYNAPAGGVTFGPTGIPTLGSRITGATNPRRPSTARPGATIQGFTTAVVCPSAAGIGRTPGLAAACSVTGDGTVNPVDSLVAANLKSTQEDEYLIGYQRQINELWKASATVTFREINRVSEDVAIDAAVLDYCRRNNLTGCGVFTGFHQYVIVNPGSDSTITLSDPINGESTLRTVDFTAEQLRYPKANREYIALELTVERAFDGKWGFNGSYTISESKGNYEGFVKSDVGQDDAGITQDFDQPGLTDGTFGLLPNHRGHVFKAFGSYAVTDNLLVGANAIVSSGKKYGCLGIHPTDTFAQAYGVASFYCNGVLTPRGSQFDNEWNKRLDLSVRYTVPSFGFIPGNLVLRADVFNVFNHRDTLEADELGETAAGQLSQNYGNPVFYQAPRSVRLGFDFNF